MESVFTLQPGQSAPQVKGAILHVGAMPPEVVRWLAKHTIEPQSAIISVTDKALLHATRNAKVKPLPPKFWKTLPQRLKNPKAILFDTTSEQKGNREDKRLSLLWILDFEGEEKRTGKAAIHIDCLTKVRGVDNKTNDKVTINMVVTGSEVKKKDNLSSKIYKMIYGKL